MTDPITVYAGDWRAEVWLDEPDTVHVYVQVMAVEYSWALVLRGSDIHDPTGVIPEDVREQLEAGIDDELNAIGAARQYARDVEREPR